MRQPRDETMGVRVPCRAQNGGVADARVPIRDVVTNRAREQHRFLKHHTDLVAQGLQGELPDIDAIDQHAPFLRIIKSRNERQQRAFTTARGADQRHAHPWLNGAIDPMQNGGSRHIVKCNMVDGDRTAQRRGRACARHITHGRLDIQDLLDAFGASICL